MKKDKCVKGISCKMSCISQNKDCISDFPPAVQPLLDGISQKLAGVVSEEALEVLKPKEVVSALQKLPEEKQRRFAEMAVLLMGTERDKSDKFAFSVEEIKGMQDRSASLDKAYEVSFRSKEGKATPESLREPGGVRDFLESQRTEDVSDEEVELLWGILPSKLKKSLTSAGALKNGNYWKPAGRQNPLDESAIPDPEGGGANQTRAKLLLKLYMRQGGRDVYTGMPLPLGEADLEHVVPFEMAGKVAEDPANWGWTRSGINGGRGKKDISDYIESNVSKKLGLKLGEDSSKSDPDKLSKIRSQYEEVRAANESRKKAKKDLESSDWLNLTKERWTEEQREIFSRMSEGLSDPSVGKGYYLIEKMFPEFNSSAAIHPIKRSSRRKVWLQELGLNLTKETLDRWANSEGEERAKIEEFWKTTGQKITEEIKTANLYDESKSKEAMELARSIVKREYEGLSS